MAFIRIRRPWEIPERLVTPESTYLSRRRFIQALGLASGALLWSGAANAQTSRNKASGPFTLDDFRGAPGVDLYPAARNAGFAVEQPLTDERTASRYNNFYEFTTSKDVYRHVRDYNPYPWTVEVAGLCNKPQRWDLERLMRSFALEERVYRFRCVEAWSMVVPWTGFRLRDLLAASEPRSDARFVLFTSVLRPAEMPGQKKYDYYEWPYYEGLRLDEAMHDLTLFTVGIYGHPLPKQHGAPWRVIVPWKYGYKSAKSIVKVEFTADQPPTFWNDSQPREYGFYSNVNPGRDHPRWSQASERVLDTGERITTLYYNGYEEQVASLYPGQDPY